ncbi:MAG: choice-of-anchor B family protein [bacterium]|nr:choice-of-anchor B family protein [bacterium]
MLFLCLVTGTSFAQLNLDSIGHIDLHTMHNQRLNDIWGYTDELGNEYALVGGTKGTSVVDISDPTSPVEVFYEPGIESTWRDLKTVGDYAYVTTEANNGLLIIDLSPLPQSTTLPVTYYYGDLTNGIWNSAHNLYANDEGYVYIFGADRGNGGVIILDVTVDPMNPVEVGEFDNWYVHDGYVENDTMYLGHISDGFFSIVDVTDKANPVLLGTQTTPSTFTHNVWTRQGGYAFTTDEVSDAYLAAYDISDPSNIVEVDRIQSSPGAGVIPHNAHVLGNYLITSYYSDGVVVHDITHPYNMVEVANYDTYPTQTTGYDGCWGVYPYFSSGLMVASDRDYGMFVLSPNYSQAAYLEGVVTNTQTSNPIFDVTVQINGSAQTENTSATGFYATGMASAGNYDVTFSKVGYYPETVPATLVNGQITVLNVELTPIPPFTLDITVLEQGTNNPIENVEIRFESSLSDWLGTTNALGQETMTLYYEEQYKTYFGKWGHVTHCEWIDIDANTGSLTIYLEPGYYDDFAFDFNWSVSGSAATGQWERAIPYGTLSSPGMDSPSDCSDYCYVTENATTQDYIIGTVHDGNVILQSPVMDLTGYTDPYVHYERWFFCDFGNAPNDSLEIIMSNGLDQATIDVQLRDTNTHGQWILRDIRVLDYLPLSSNMQLTVRTADFPSAANVTEAAFDDFFIVESQFVSIPEEEKEKWQLQPNPSTGIIRVANLTSEVAYEVRSLSGKLVQSGRVKPEQSIDGSLWESGVYFVKINDEVQKMVIAR